MLAKPLVLFLGEQMLAPPIVLFLGEQTLALPIGHHGTRVVGRGRGFGYAEFVPNRSCHSQWVAQFLFCASGNLNERPQPRQPLQLALGSSRTSCLVPPWNPKTNNNVLVLVGFRV